MKLMNPELSAFQHAGHCGNWKSVETSNYAKQGTETAVSQEQTLDGKIRCDLVKRLDLDGLFFFFLKVAIALKFVKQI